MRLPSELVMLVTEYLDGSNLKSGRLVSKVWCSCASEFLFKKIYVSANKIDFDTFNAITNHPFLSKCVRCLVYDGSEFILDYSKAAYLYQLRSQTFTIFSRNMNRLSDYQDKETCDWVTAVVGKHQYDSEATIERLRDSKFITQGYEKYHEHAVYQHHSLRSGSFADGLTQGLRKLPLLSSIGVEDEWSMSSDGNPLGSPLSRNWDPFHAYPTRWAWDETSISLGCPNPNGIEHYFILVSALVRAQRKIESLRFSHIPPEVFDRADHSKPSVLSLDVVAFSGLEMLDLNLSSWYYGDGEIYPETCPNIHGLRVMLSSMTRLQGLYLCLPFGASCEFDQIFTKDTIWTHFKTLQLCSLSNKATDLVDLLTFQMPELQHLCLSDLVLLDGTWESVIECLKQYTKLSKFVTWPRSLSRKDGTTLQRHSYEPYDFVSGALTARFAWLALLEMDNSHIGDLVTPDKRFFLHRTLDLA
ncbi:hypothetical protein BDR22DRAFT_826026 [Usnea florida]